MYFRIEYEERGGEAALIATAADSINAPRAMLDIAGGLTITFISGSQKDELLAALNVLGRFSGYENGDHVKQLRDAAANDGNIIVVGEPRLVTCVDERSVLYQEVRQIYASVLKADEEGEDLDQAYIKAKRDLHGLSLVGSSR